ncbi:MAG: 2-hydroxyacid dehydrogenase [Prolixibacteraceae bacterium]
MKILFYSTRDFEKPFFEKLNDHHDISFIYEPLTLQTASLSKGYDAIFIFPNDDCSSNVVRQLNAKGIHYISTRSKGYDHIDYNLAKELGMIVGRVPDYSPYSVAEHTIALLMTLNRSIHKAYNRNIKWDFRLENLMGFDLHLKVVGVIGVGKIGSVVVKILTGFGCKVIAYDPVRYPFLVDAYNLEYVDSVDELYKRADILTIHAPLNDQTTHMICRESLSAMKDGVVILNTARGGIVKTIDLIESIDCCKVAFYGSDVYENEREYFFSDWSLAEALDGTLERLLSFENVLITSHQASLTDQAMEDIARACLTNVNCWENGTNSGNEM